ncbi:MAG TPA: GTP-binding protein [Streptomyces sp.]|uniref:GTP-binding protein n=1 Tax=Streptomyces sp. TaxID=1931 RepID=UPI002CFCC1EC|nr:GTP-binding protein [Streptomyces sp.]HWU05146.1 GTP-binding protein [Streptomyces sp.]
MSKGLLSVVTGNTPAVRGEAVDRLLRLSTDAVVLAVSVHGRHEERPSVQRFLSGRDPRIESIAPKAATGSPAVILRQDLLSLRRTAGSGHVILALPENLDILPFLVELWRTRSGATSLGDHYAAAPVLVAVDPVPFMADIGCVHQAVRLWNGWGRTAPLTQAEAAARQVESADVLHVPAGEEAADNRYASGVASLAEQINGAAPLLDPSADERRIVHPLPADFGEQWLARLDPVVIPGFRRGTAHLTPAVRSVRWRARRPVHPQRLADALTTVMRGVVRSRGHLWLSSRPDAVVTWRSAGAHLELREAGRWLEPGDARAWQAVTPQRRTLASWFWHDCYGERRNEIVFTGVDLDEQAIRLALHEALLTGHELAQGRDTWAAVPDPLLG